MPRQSFHWSLNLRPSNIPSKYRFEEMRIRYERREPRAEDIREIDELKSVIDAQDKDLRKLTEQLREMQMYQQFDPRQLEFDQQQQQLQLQQQQELLQQTQAMRTTKPKKAKINCDVIYEEENEEQELPASNYIKENDVGVLVELNAK